MIMSTSYVCVECGTVYEVPTTSYVCDNPGCPGKGLTGLLIPNKKTVTTQPGTKKSESNFVQPSGNWSRPFSFKGRIRRREFGISLIISIVSLGILALIADLIYSPESGFFLGLLFVLFLIPILWFNYAQTAKRLHDLNF